MDFARSRSRGTRDLAPDFGAEDFAAPTLDAFAATLTGSIARPSNEPVDFAAAAAGVVDERRRPTATVRAAGAADVARTVVFAGQAGLELEVRDAGRAPGDDSRSDQAIVLDLSPMSLAEIKRRFDPANLFRLNQSAQSA